ncbi:hypothetical protein HX869_13500 [Pseudomonas sp. P7779]|uniref:DUF6945 domain-containing protein n=1 Tax=Pseudomonas sp. P7779 TaxID=2738832 RepID=UPI0015BCA5C5|nr:helix-turn-helix domain-containing protein [Pseudomonas sp. P7779]NWC99756.1 hypothetical protein [Pseudomonas sp. P7779]
MTEQFCKLTHEMMRATHWTSRTTGEQFKLTGDQKVMWTWMEKRYKFFRSLGKDWFDNQEDIAESTGCDPSTVKRFISRLTQHGYIEVEHQKGRGFIRSNKYKILAPLQVHASKTSVSPSELSFSNISPTARVGLDGPLIDSQELVGELIPAFENVPIGVYVDTPPEAPVIVHERLQGFGYGLDVHPSEDAPLVKRGAVIEYISNDPLRW